MKVKILKKHPAAVIPFKIHDSDYCYDVVATSCEEIAPNVYRYGTGLAFQMELDPKDRWSPELRFSIDARPRSSVWKTGMILSNCEGTVDRDYTGEVSFVFYHVLPSMPKYEVGDKICQIKLGCTMTFDFVEVDSLDETERGEGREGSTGR